MKKVSLIAIIGFFVFALSPNMFAQANKKAEANNVSPKSEVPTNAPQFIDTGNAQRDAINYENAKKAWYAANPQEAKKAGMSNGTGMEIPGFKATGDPKIDGPAYDKAKEEWVRQNPEAYKKALKKSN